MSRRKTKNKSTNDSLNTSISPCIICLDEVSVRGKITVCDHWFCFACILEWSKNTNTCPLCKERFRTISKIHLSALKSPTSKVRVPDKDQRVWNDDDDIAYDDLINDIQNDMRDEMDSDYQPVASGWSTAHISDDYDFEDSFIDDSNISQALSFEEHFYLDVDSDDSDLIDDSDDDDNDDDDSTDYFSSDFDDDDDSDDDDDDSDDDDVDSDDGCDSDDESRDEKSEDDYSEGFDDLYTQDSSGRGSRSKRPKASLRSRTSKSTRTSSSRTKRATKSSSSSKSTTAMAKRKPKSGFKKKTTKKKTATTKRLNSRPRKQQTNNHRQQDDATIAQRLQETGSSGWLSTGRRSRRTATSTTTLQSATGTSHRQRSTRNNRTATSRRNVRPADITLNDSDESNDDLQIVSTSTTRKRKTSRIKESRANVTACESQTISDSDEDFNTHLATLRQETTNNQHRPTKTRSLRSLENSTSNIVTNNQRETKGKGKRKNETGKGKENIQPLDMFSDSERKKIKLQQTTLDDYTHDNLRVKPGRAKYPRKSATNRRDATSSGSYGNLYSAGPSTSTDYWDDDDNHRDSHTTDSEAENETIVLPTPQDKNKRSLFTKRQHKPISCGFDVGSDERIKVQNACFKATAKKSNCTVQSPAKKKSRRRIKVYDSESD